MNRIQAKNLGKKFKIGFHKRQTFLAGLLSTFSGVEPKKEFWALEDVSFTAKSGDAVGIIGANGSGKSTLLSIIAGIYQSDAGTIKTDGNVISVIGLAHGLKDRLTLRENIYLCCTLFGLSRREIGAQYDSIVQFAELEDYTHTKLYQFSAGMLGRTVFSIAVHCRPDILLLDEVTNHIDRKFLRKGFETLQDLRKKGSTLLLVSHEKYVIKGCDTTLWLESGRIKRSGKTDSIVKEYFQ